MKKKLELKKLKSLDDFKNGELKNLDLIKGGEIGSGMTDIYDQIQTGPYHGECDCISTRDGHWWDVDHFRCD